MMKKFLVLLLLVVSVLPLSAKKDTNVSCVLTLNNDKQVKGWFVKEGYGTYGPYNVKNVNEVTLASDKDKKNCTTYRADDAKSLACTDENTGNKNEYLSLYSVKNFTRAEKLNPSGHKFFWLVAYKGKKVYGLLSMSRIYTAYSSYNGIVHQKSEDANAYSYCLKGDNIAVTYFVPESGITIGLKADIKRQFKRFPKMVEYLDSDEFKMKTFKKSPFFLLEKLEDLL